jgi:hypothetical protein
LKVKSQKKKRKEKKRKEKKRKETLIPVDEGPSSI